MRVGFAETNMNKVLARSLSLAWTAGVIILLAACGGGGGGATAPADATDSPIPPTTSLGGSAQYASICDLETQKKFVRAYLDEVYLWYSEIRDVEPSLFAYLPDYFSALLVRTPDVNGQPKDRFSVALPSWLLQGGDATAATAADGGLLAAHTSSVPVAQVVTTAGGRAAGYLQFNDHQIGAQDDLIQAFQQMQAAGVPDLVLDLRFNSGGYVYSRKPPLR